MPTQSYCCELCASHFGGGGGSQSIFWNYKMWMGVTWEKGFPGQGIRETLAETKLQGLHYCRTSQGLSGAIALWMPICVTTEPSSKSLWRTCFYKTEFGKLQERIQSNRGNIQPPLENTFACRHRRVRLGCTNCRLLQLQTWGHEYYFKSHFITVFQASPASFPSRPIHARMHARTHTRMLYLLSPMANGLLVLSE